METDFRPALLTDDDWLQDAAIHPPEHEEAVLAAAAFLDEYDMTPFDTLHAGVITTSDAPVLSTEQDYDTVGLDRIPLAPESKE